MSRIRLNIDGTSVEVEPGTTLLEAARAQGAEIPTLCHDDRLDPYGGCRLCLVDLEGAPRPVPACKTQCADGMKMQTQTEGLRRVRRTMLDMLLADHHEDVGVKPNRLMELAEQHGLKAPSVRLGRRAAYDDRNRWIGFNPGACILCDRCVRYCDEVMQCSALEHVAQGPAAAVQPVGRQSFLDTDCELCGGCVSTCPTGALYEKQALNVFDPVSVQIAESGAGLTAGSSPGSTVHPVAIAEQDCEKTRTVCTFCGVGCVLDLNVKDGKVVKVTAETGVGPNDGNLCNKGKFSFEFIHHSERLTAPLVRGEDGELHETSWEDALDLVANGLKTVAEKSGPDSVAFLASSRCTNEDVYILQKLARVAIGTNNVHSCAAT